MMKSHLTLAFALLLVCTGAGVALAQTPDPCGDETGAAYGLCNAYVAAECQTDTPSASDVACSRIADKFLQITGRDLPSKFATCPCAVPGSLFAQVLSGQVAIQSCFNNVRDREIEDGVQVNFSDTYAFSFLSGGWGCGVPGVSLLPLTPEQGQDCAQQLEEAANNQGVTCVPF